jgi:hypothetical protein
MGEIKSGVNFAPAEKKAEAGMQAAGIQYATDSIHAKYTTSFVGVQAGLLPREVGLNWSVGFGHCRMNLLYRANQLHY